MFDSLERFIEEVKSLPRERAKYDEVLRGITFGMDEIQAYCHFSQDFYTRNLILRTDDFELLVLCWEPGQITPIHNHSGSVDRFVHAN